MSDIVGKWQQPQGQPFPGLYFEFRADGTFQATYEEMGIISGGTYTAADGLIDIDQAHHTLGLLGKFLGRYVIEGDTLTMTLGDPAAPRPANIDEKNRRIYKKMA